jgi:SAM-dependent methyltransferase
MFCLIFVVYFMHMVSSVDTFINRLQQAVLQQQFIKLSLGNYKGSEPLLKQLLVKPVLIKNSLMLSFVYRYQTKDITKNYEVEEALTILTNFLNHGFNVGTLFTTNSEVIIELQKNQEFRIRTKAVEESTAVNLLHNKEKHRLILGKDNVYLNALGLTDANGLVFKKGQDKYKQINQYIEILSSLIKEFPKGTIANVVDMGSGKGYLTFALYDYLLNHQQKANVVGVEFRRDMVDLCNAIANKANFDALSFVEGTIDSYNKEDIDLLIALHACDTATDDAIAKGIKANAELIVVAPCCHKQIRREIEKGKAKNDLDFLTKHGIFLERQAEMVTDGIRALILEYFGYKTKVIEFISDVHTPKNVLVVGIKNMELGAKNKDLILDKIKSTKAYFGIGYHHLERLLGL